LTHQIEIDGQTIPVRLRWNKQARRLILRLDPKSDGVVITLPHGVDEQDGLKMALKNKVWIANQLSKTSPASAFEDGETILLRGHDVLLKHLPDARGTVWQEGDTIMVAGKPEFLHRRLTDWLKKQAKDDITPQAHDMAAILGKKVKRISVRDTVSRWGSCSSTGKLSFNWRLIFAPPEVLEYVVAHEVSHLVHMNHSKAFWETVDQFDVNINRSRAWLRKNGSLLQKFGL
jgi:predicted metal-dependent hydrolase